jgi:hypothetical protein
MKGIAYHSFGGIEPLFNECDGKQQHRLFLHFSIYHTESHINKTSQKTSTTLGANIALHQWVQPPAARHKTSRSGCNSNIIQW